MLPNHIVIKIGGRPLLQAPAFDKIDTGFLRTVCTFSKSLALATTSRLILVPGGACAHLFVEAARAFGASESECDRIGICVTTAVGYIFLDALKQAGADPYPALINTPEALDDAKEHTFSVAAPGRFQAISSDSLSALIAEHCGGTLVIVKRALGEDIRELLHSEKGSRWLAIQDLMANAIRKPARACQHPFLDILSLKIIERSRFPSSILLRDDLARIAGASAQEILASGIQIRLYDGSCG